MFESVPNMTTLRNYLEMATGLTEATAAKAMEVAGSLIAQGMSLGTKQPADVASSVAQAADDLMEQSKSNRDLLVSLIRSEVDKAIGRVGFVREDELAALRARVDKVESSFAYSENNAASPAPNSEVAEAAIPLKKKKVAVEHES